jgi:hypothetical protein
MRSGIREISALFEYSRTSPACPSDKDSIVMRIYGMNETDKEKLGEKPVPLPLCQKRISQGQLWDETRGLKTTINLHYI